MDGDNNNDIENSNIKLIPNITIIKTTNELSYWLAFVTSSNQGEKNEQQPIVKMPVLIIGTEIDAKMEPNIFILLDSEDLNGRQMSPHKNPARPVLRRQISTVPKGATDIKIAWVDGDNIVTNPLTKPINNPDNGPNTIPATVIGTNAKLMLTGPIDT